MAALSRNILLHPCSVRKIEKNNRKTKKKKIMESETIKKDSKKESSLYVDKEYFFHSHSPRDDVAFLYACLEIRDNNSVKCLIMAE